MTKRKKLGLLDGWSRDSLRGEVTYEIGELLYKDYSVRPMCLYISPGGTRPGREYMDSDVVERRVFAGRYKAALECFTHTDDEAEARYYFLASDALLAFDPMQLAESPDLERKAMQKAWALGWIDLDLLLGRCFPETVPMYAATMTPEQLQQLLWYAMTFAPWLYDLDGVGKEYDGAYDGAIVELMRVAFPHAGNAIKLFQEQILAELPKFEKQPEKAKAYLLGLVNQEMGESFELPILG